MTESPLHVRAVARVGADAPRRAGPATLLPRRRPGYLGSIHVMQLLLAEVAVVAVLAVLTRGIIAVVVAVVLGLALVAVTLGRRQGRWWLERRVMTWQFRRRRRGRPNPVPTDPRLAALQWLAPGLGVADLPAPDGSQVGVARDEAGWYAVAAVTVTAAMRDDPQPPLPLGVLVEALTETSQPGAVAQVVTHTVPVSSRGDAAANSYRELLQQFGPVPVPVDRATWIAVRLDARALAEVGADLPEQTAQAPAVVAALLRRLVKALRRAGVSAQSLDREGLLDALARSCDLAPAVTAPGTPAPGTPAPGTPAPGASAPGTPAPAFGLPPTVGRPTPVQPREDWHVWYSGRLAHRSFWLQGWPSVAQAGALLDWLATAPAALTSVSLVLAPEGDDIDIRSLIRVAAAPDQLAAVCQAVAQGARLAHAQLLELDGEQGPAAYASAPTGGGPR